jgi:hypothetical protein
MHPGVEEIYSEIGGLVFKVAPVDWFELTAVYHAGDYQKSDGIFLRHTCLDGTRGHPDYRAVTMPLMRAFERLRHTMADQDQPSWLAARFVVGPDGDFAVDFDYDDALRWDDEPKQRQMRNHHHRARD